MSKRPSADEWRGILSEQKERGMRDEAWAQIQGVSVWALRYWRRRQREREQERPGAADLVEVPVSRSAGELRVILPNGVVLSAGPSWPVDRLVQVASLLRSL